MKKALLFLLLVLPIFISCDNVEKSKTDDEEPPVKPTIDKRLIGRWKVTYSKTINPALYIENEEELKKFHESLNYHIGVNYPESALITEYFGDWEEKQIPPESYMFNNHDIGIEINENNTIDVVPNDGRTKSEVYCIENGYLKWNTIPGYENPIKIRIKYTIENNTLIMELIWVENIQWNKPYYVISKYRKIE